MFRSIEINGTFYSMQRCESFAHWADATPDDFVFAVKGPRYLTHMLKLQQCRGAARQFLRLGRAAAGRQARPDPLAVSAELPLQPSRSSRPSSSCCRATPSRPPFAAAGMIIG